MAAEIRVSALEGRRFRVQVRAGSVETTHEVSVPSRLRGGLEFGGDDLAAVVRESFLFLLEREGPTSILPRFSLDDISRYFPEFPEEIRRRLA
jgi:hypothetical protein